MWFRMVLMVPVLLPTLVVKTISCSNASSSDVFFKYSGHVEANAFSPEPRVVFNSPETTVKPAPPPVATNPPTIFHRPVTSPPTTPPLPVDEDTEAVVFIPNAAPVVRIEDEEAERRGFKLHELMDRTRVNDVMDKHFRVETESPDQVVFVAQKNQDDIAERMEEERKERKKQRRKEKDQTTETPVLDCVNLECNNTIKSVCGVKNVNKKLQYRLFLNECYFRKVNCNFKYAANRYTEVPIERCEKIGAHVEERPFSFRPRYYEDKKNKVNVIARRSFSSRRSMAMNVDGDFCSHPCPVSCPDDYEPECAVSATGQRKVFMNHCKLDDNSCLFAVDAICKRTPAQSSPISISTDENNSLESQDDKRTNTPTDKQTNSHRLIDFENEIEEFKITSKKEGTSNNKFKAKKQKLEHILGNIKNVKSNKSKDTNEVKNINANEVRDNEMKKNFGVEKSRRLSTSTDGEDLSDLSINDEEVLKNLENIQIPIEQTGEQNEDKKIEIDIIGTETKERKGSLRKKVIPVPIKNELSMPRITVKQFARKPIVNELIVPDKMPPLTRKPDIKVEKPENSNSTDYLDNVSLSSFKFISDDDVSLIDDKEKSSLGESSSCIDTTDEIKEANEIKKEQIDTANATGTNNKVFFRKKVIKDLSEYITVYKIMSQENEKNAIDSEKSNKNADNTNNVSGKLNKFFKKRKSNKRVVKSDSSFPANSLTAVKDVPIDNVKSDEKTSVVNDENRLKPCECVVKTENGLPCDTCNFSMDKEVGKNHVSSCKDVARIPWNHNYITNQT